MTTENAKMYNEESRDKLLQIFLNSPFNALPLCGTWQAKDRHTHTDRESASKKAKATCHTVEHYLIKIVLNMQRNLNMRLTDTANMIRSCACA